MIRQIGDPEKDAAFMRSRSPLFSVDKIRRSSLPRVKTIHASENEWNPTSWSRPFRKMASPWEYSLKADEGHGFMKPENRVEFFQKMEAFLEKYLK